MRMIHKLYGLHYFIEQLMVSPEDVGHSAVARDRTYLILWHKKKVVKMYDPQVLYQDRTVALY